MDSTERVRRDNLLMTYPRRPVLGLSMDDSLWRNALLSHRLLEGMRADENLGWEQELLRLIGFGVYDCNDPGHPSWRSDVRSMRHSAGMVLILWTILKLQEEACNRTAREVLLMSQ